VTYNNSDRVFYLHGFYDTPYSIPIGATIEYWGTSAPTSSFIFPAGQQISRTTYATLFSLFGTTYGSGDGTTTFNVPDLAGRVTAMKEATATRLTSAESGVDGATMGSAGGTQSKTLITANLPAYTPAGSVSVSVTSTVSNIQVNSAGNGSINNPGGSTSWPVFNSATLASTGTGTFTGTAQGGTSTPFATIPPLIVCNKILRII
jgi:microcystin-dependent protein